MGFDTIRINLVINQISLSQPYQSMKLSNDLIKARCLETCSELSTAQPQIVHAAGAAAGISRGPMALRF